MRCGIMWLLSKNKRVFPLLSLIFFTACAPSTTVTYQSQPTVINSPVPVGVEISENLKDTVRLERVVVIRKGDNYIIQLTLRNFSDSPLNVLYKVDLYNSSGLKVDFLTSKWAVLEIDSKSEKIVKVLVPKRIVGNLSSVKVYLKTFEKGG